MGGSRSRSGKRPRVRESLPEADLEDANLERALAQSLQSSDLAIPDRARSLSQRTPSSRGPASSAQSNQAQSGTKNPREWTVRERLTINGINFVSWGSAPDSIKEAVNTILGCYLPTSAQAVNLADRAKEIHADIQGGDLTEMSLLLAILPNILPEPRSPSALIMRENTSFFCGTEPKGIMGYTQPNLWAPIPVPRADVIVGYRLTPELANQLDYLPASFRIQALKTTRQVVCAQLVVEFKSDQKRGSMHAGLDQAAGASATCANALAHLYDTIKPNERPGDADLLARLRDCIVFGLVIDEFAAHLTVTWRVVPSPSPAVQQIAGAEPGESASQGRARAKSDRQTELPPINSFDFALVSLHALFDEEKTLEFLEKVEGIRQWMEGRRADITEAIGMIV